MEELSMKNALFESLSIPLAKSISKAYELASINIKKHSMLLYLLYLGCKE